METYKVGSKRKEVTHWQYTYFSAENYNAIMEYIIKLLTMGYTQISVKLLSEKEI